MVINQFSSPTSWTKSCLFSSKNTLSSRISRKGVEQLVWHLVSTSSLALRPLIIQRIWITLTSFPSYTFDINGFSKTLILSDITILFSISKMNLSKTFLIETQVGPESKSPTRSIQEEQCDHDYIPGGQLYAIPFKCSNDTSRHVNVQTWFGNVQGYVDGGMCHHAGVDLPRQPFGGRKSESALDTELPLWTFVRFTGIVALELCGAIEKPGDVDGCRAESISQAHQLMRTLQKHS